MRVNLSKKGRKEVTDALAYHLDLLRGLREEQLRAIAEIAVGGEDAIATAVLLSRDIVKSERGNEWLREILARYDE
jgi:hypothetical protein